MLLALLSKNFSRVLAGGIALFSLSPVFAAKLLELSSQPPQVLNQYVQEQSPQKGAPMTLMQTNGLPPQVSPQTTLVEVNRLFFKRKVHVRAQENYQGYPVWGAQVVVHAPDANAGANAKPLGTMVSTTPGGSLDGYVYQGLDADLKGAPAYVFSKERREQAVAQAIKLYQQSENRGGEMIVQSSSLLIYVDDKQKAHWTYYIQLKSSPAQGLPARPNYLMDAISFDVYESWNNLHTGRDMDATQAGGFGGNPKIGKLIYDGLRGDLPALDITRSKLNGFCYLQNKDVVVQDMRRKNAVEIFACRAPDAQHNNLYWHGSVDAFNGGYSPSNDALFLGKIVQGLYQEWYGIPPLVKEGKPMVLTMRVHDQMENAYWDGDQMTFGDGGYSTYPLVSIGVGAHEISHGFTEQHSNLIYFGQSGGLNESFSDMAAQAAEYYVYGKSSWTIGGEIMKDENEVFRYMDHPARDCKRQRTEFYQCSIENVRDYTRELDVHMTSGVFNRAFYLIATAPGWDTHKAFDIMVQANRFYWTPKVFFRDAACGVLKATKDYGYPEQAVIDAFTEVGINVKLCHFA